ETALCAGALLMRRLLSFSALAIALTTAGIFSARANEAPVSSPALSDVPELREGFHQLYSLHFPEARSTFHSWGDAHPSEPFPQAAIAASYLFEELYRQSVLSSDFFLNEKRFLHGIERKPNAERMKDFRGALANARSLAKARLAEHPKDPEALFALTMC